MAKANLITEIKLSELQFDRKNPRLAEFDISSESSDEQIMSVLWDNMDVLELVQSISASGYFPHEPLIVAIENKKNIVIEGNRRLAAVRALTNPSIPREHGWEVPSLGPVVVKKLNSLPVVIQSRNQSWRHLGFKHVNGPAKWSSYAKARYIAQVHKQYNVSLADISLQIGDRHKTVQRLFRGLMVIEQAENSKVFDREDKFKPRFAFSHLYTGLDYDGISEFLELSAQEEESKTPVPKKKLENLGELCVWLYGSKRENIPPLIQSQNPDLRYLNSVLKSRDAIAAIRSGILIEKAYDLSRPAAAVLEESLLAAKRSLRDAKSYITAGFNESLDLLKIAGSVANLADSVYEEMERKIYKEKKERVSED